MNKTCETNNKSENLCKSLIEKLFGIEMAFKRNRWDSSEWDSWTKGQMRQIKEHIINGTKSKLNGQTKDDLSTLGRSPSEKPH